MTRFSLVATLRSTSLISGSVGAATRMPRHLLRRGAMILHRELAIRTSRVVAVYFSRVLRRAACASSLSWSAWFRMITLKKRPSGFLLLPISLIICCTTILSRKPTSLGVMSMWKLLCSTVISAEVVPALKLRTSHFTLDTPAPKMV